MVGSGIDDVNRLVSLKLVIVRHCLLLRARTEFWVLGAERIPHASALASQGCCGPYVRVGEQDAIELAESLLSKLGFSKKEGAA